MRRLFELRDMPTDVVLRAAAISFVVLNHATPAALRGGAAFLLLLSGLNFARFAVNDRTARGTRQSILETARKVFVPSLAMVLISFAFYGTRNVFELLFVSNWQGSAPPAVFITWYSQMLLQLLAGLYVLSWIPLVGTTTVRRPAFSMMALFAVGLLFRAYEPWVLDESHSGRLPHTLLWHFALGAVVYFFALDATTSRPLTRWIAAGCVVAGALVGHDTGDMRFWWITLGGLLLVSVRHIPLPYLLMRVTTVVSAAAFGIYLTHPVWLKVIRRLNQEWAGPHGTAHPLVLFVFGLLLSTLTWAAFVAFGRAYRAVQPESAGPLLAE